MFTIELGRKKIEHSAKISGSFFAEDKGSEVRRCFGCGEEGHIRRHCPKGKNQNRSFDEKKPRRPPKIKKHWCAYHKEDQSKRCWSNSCQDLRKFADVNKRIQLLKENGDVSIVVEIISLLTVYLRKEFVVVEKKIVDAQDLITYTSCFALLLKCVLQFMRFTH